MEKIDLKSVKIALERDEMLEIAGGSGFLTSCGGATVGLVIGFAGLCAGGASIVGAGIGAAGFIYASAQWGASCR